MQGRKSERRALVGAVLVGAAAQPAEHERAHADRWRGRRGRPYAIVNVTVSSKITPGRMPGELAPRYPL